MGTKAERRAARERVAAYHEARLAELIEYTRTAVSAMMLGARPRCPRSWKFHAQAACRYQVEGLVTE